MELYECPRCGFKVRSAKIFYAIHTHGAKSEPCGGTFEKEKSWRRWTGDWTGERGRLRSPVFRLNVNCRNSNESAGSGHPGSGLPRRTGNTWLGKTIFGDLHGVRFSHLLLGQAYGARGSTTFSGGIKKEALTFAIGTGDHGFCFSTHS